MGLSTSGTQALYSSLADDPDLAEIVEMFVDEMPGRIEALIQQYDQANFPELGRLAHQIKGAAGSYGFGDITPYAAKLESAAKSQQAPDQITAALEDLLTMCRSVRAGTPA